MEATARRRLDQARRLTGRHFAIGGGVGGVGVGDGGEEGVGVGVERVAQQFVDRRLLDHFPGVHDKDAFREVAHG